MSPIILFNSATNALEVLSDELRGARLSIAKVWWSWCGFKAKKKPRSKTKATEVMPPTPPPPQLCGSIGLSWATQLDSVSLGVVRVAWPQPFTGHGAGGSWSAREMNGGWSVTLSGWWNWPALCNAWRWPRSSRVLWGGWDCSWIVVMIIKEWRSRRRVWRAQLLLLSAAGTWFLNEERIDAYEFPELRHLRPLWLNVVFAGWGICK